MQRFRVECNFGSKYFDDIFNARRYFYKCIERDLQVELWKVTYHHCAAKKEYSAKQELRLGKKVLENNPKAGSFEFGVVAITEIGKERGNNLELKEVKKVTNETNQKNDLFNSWLKMCRHSATIDN